MDFQRTGSVARAQILPSRAKIVQKPKERHQCCFHMGCRSFWLQHITLLKMYSNAPRRTPNGPIKGSKGSQGVSKWVPILPLRAPNEPMRSQRDHGETLGPPRCNLRAPRCANKAREAILWRILRAQNGAPGDLLSKMGVFLREHEIQKSIWRYCTSENGDCRLNTKLDVCKLQKFSNRSGACIVVQTVIFRSAAVAKQGTRYARVGGSGLADGGVRGGKPPQGTGGRTYSSIDAMYPLDTADLRRCA